MALRHVWGLRNRPLRSGFTTGACAAAAAKAASLMLKTPASSCQFYPLQVEIPFPDGSRHALAISHCQRQGDCVSASIIKDAGDDPDVTNGAEIIASARLIEGNGGIVIRGGRGVGIVTKPGLPVKVGEPAINPIPLRMIHAAIMETPWWEDEGLSQNNSIEVTIAIANGEELAKKTLNYRLGIVKGLSVLGTTGIVRPLSAEAWTATIVSAMDVAKATGQREIVLSTGRTSESAHIRNFNLPEECYVMMGDYIEFALREALNHNFEVVHLCAQWAKMLKIAMGAAQTHVRFGALEVHRAIELLCSLAPEEEASRIISKRRFNTAREAFELLHKFDPSVCQSYIRGVLKQVALRILPTPGRSILIVHLVSYDNRIIASFNYP